MSNKRLSGYYHRNQQPQNSTDNPAGNSISSSPPVLYYNFPLNANLLGGASLPNQNFPYSGSITSNSNSFLLHQGHHNSMRSGLGGSGSSLHGNVNILLGGAMLSVVITILCVVCYCCHRNIKKRTESAYRQRWLENDANMEIYSVEQCYETSGLFMDSQEGLSVSQIPTLNHEPPPSYDTVLAMDEILHSHHGNSPPPGYRSTNSINYDIKNATSDINPLTNSLINDNSGSRKYQLRNCYRPSVNNNGARRSIRSNGSRKNLNFRMLRTESCCSLERALGGCGQSTSSSDSNILENTNTSYNQCTLEIHNTNSSNSLRNSGSEPNDCSLCGKLRSNTEASALQNNQSIVLSSTDSGIENLIQIDTNSGTNNNIQYNQANNLNKCECSNFSQTNLDQINSQILPGSSSFQSTIPSLSVYSLQRNYMNTSESNNKLPSIYTSCNNFIMDTSRDISSENISLMDLNEDERLLRPIENADSNRNNNIENSSMENTEIRYSNENLNIRNNNEQTHQLPANNQGITVITNSNNNNMNMNNNNNVNLTSTTSATSITELDSLNENGIIRMDMSQIIDRTGLPTYEAALKLESSGYV